MEEQAIIPMSEYKRLKEAYSNQEKIEITYKINPWTTMKVYYLGENEAIESLSEQLDTALGLIDEFEQHGLWGRAFYSGFKEEY